MDQIRNRDRTPALVPRRDLDRVDALVGEEHLEAAPVEHVSKQCVIAVWEEDLRELDSQLQRWRRHDYEALLWKRIEC